MSQTHLLWRLSACVLLVLVYAGCSRGESSATIGRSGSASPPVNGDPAEAVAGLCLARQQASTDLPAAKATYEQRSRQAVEATIESLQGSYSVVAASVAEAAAVVEADVATEPPRPTLGLDLSRLIETTRRGLALLGTTTSACEKEGRR